MTSTEGTMPKERCKSARARFRNLKAYSLILTTAGLVTGFLLLWIRSDWIDPLLVEPLEHRFKRSGVSPDAQLKGIIALAGDPRRFAEAGRLARIYTNLKVVISDHKDVSKALAELGGGIDPSRIVLETRSSNTYENAIYCAELIRPTPGERWLLVTGALHMARAVGSFRAAAFEVEPWPVFETIPLPPGAVSLKTSAVHEWLGLIAYRVLGRTHNLFPGPAN